MPTDVTKPTVTITAPKNHANVTRSSTVVITASATDNVKVTKVEFRVNNVLRCTLTMAPYTCNWAVPAATNVVYTLTATAYDAAGNSGNQSITVTSR